MRHLTAAQMREADRRCIQEIGIPGAVLMNNAGAAVFKEVAPGSVAVICGKGNNGGDGFVVARMALVKGHDVRVVLLTEPAAVTGDAALFLRAYQKLGGKTIVAATEEAAAKAVAATGDAATLVDAILGTGITGEVRGVPRAAIESWPHGYTVAIDVPSGMNADTGEIAGPCIRAHVTVTFQFPKAGFQNPAADEYLGRLLVADIDIPPICADDDKYKKLAESWNKRE